MALPIALFVGAGSLATFGAATYFKPEDGLESSEPEPEPVIEQEPVVQEEPVVESTVEPEPEPEPVVEPEPEPEQIQQGGQKGGIGRPTWEAVNPGSTLQADLGLSGTSANIVAKATGTYKGSPDDIQKSLKNIDDQLRVLQVKKFNLEKNRELQDQILGSTATGSNDTIRDVYIKQYNIYLTNKTLYDYKDKAISKIVNEGPVNEDTRSLREQYKDFLTENSVTTHKPEHLDDATKKTDLFNYFKSIKSKLPEKLQIPEKTSGKNPKDTNADGWWGNLKSSLKTTTSDPSGLQKLLKERSDAFELYTKAEDEVEKYKDKYERAIEKIKDIRKDIQEVNKQIKELKEKKDLLLIDLTNYHTEPKVEKSILPTGNELNTLVEKYKEIQSEIKDIDEDIESDINTNIDPETGKLKQGSNYDKLKRDRDTKEFELKEIIQKIEGRHASQQTTLGQLNDLNTFIKLLKSKNIKSYKLFETDFSKVYDTIVKLSNDENLLPNLDKYYRFFGRPLSNLKLSSYNGENLDKVMLFFNTYEKIVKDELKTEISVFVTKFNSYITKSQENINKTITLVQANDPKKLKEELDKLDSTRRAILEGRSPTWQSFLENTPKLNLDFIFKTDLQKLQKIKENFQKRIVDKLETQNITKSLSFEKQKYVKGEPTNPIGLTLRGFIPGPTAAPPPDSSGPTAAPPPGPETTAGPTAGPEPGSAAGTGLPLDPPTDEECITYVNGELTGEERTQRQITEERVNELVTDDFTIRKVKICLANLQIAILPPEPGGEPPGGEPPGGEPPGPEPPGPEPPGGEPPAPGGQPPAPVPPAPQQLQDPDSETRRKLEGGPLIFRLTRNYKPIKRGYIMNTDPDKNLKKLIKFILDFNEKYGEMNSKRTIDEKRFFFKDNFVNDTNAGLMKELITSIKKVGYSQTDLDTYNEIINYKSTAEPDQINNRKVGRLLLEFIRKANIFLNSYANRINMEGGYTRRQGFLSNPSRRKTRRT